MSGKGAISEMPIVRLPLIEGIGLDVIQASKPGPQVMLHELSDFEWTSKPNPCLETRVSECDLLEGSQER